MWKVHVRVSKRVSGKEMEGDAKGLLQTFLFHKNKCSVEFKTYVLSTNYYVKISYEDILCKIGNTANMLIMIIINGR